MRVPFIKAIRQSKGKGLVCRAAMLLVASFRFVLQTATFLPESAIVKINGSDMLLFPRKADINYELFMYRKREPTCTDYLMYSGILKAGDAVLDIGANIGYYVLLESKLVGEEGHVYAVEPVLGNLNVLKRNLQLNDVKNVSLFQFALGDACRDSEIYVSNFSNLSAMNRASVSTVIAVQPVSEQTVDNFLKDKALPTLIRMDVEGYEYEVIKGMTETLKKNVKILVELHPHYLLSPEKLAKLYDILEQNDFKVKFMIYDTKVIEHKLIRLFLRKCGSELPIVASNISIHELKEITETNFYLPTLPTVCFEKRG